MHFTGQGYIYIISEFNKRSCQSYKETYKDRKYISDKTAKMDPSVSRRT